MENMKDATKIVKFKYPSEKHIMVTFIFNHSSCHCAFSDDTLNAHVMNVRPGGAQPAMQDTMWAEKGTEDGGLKWHTKRHETHS